MGEVRLGPALLLLVFVVATPGAQSPQNPPQTPIFRGGINLVPVDVRVVDRDGKPITDLKQEEFTILENGVPQVIRHFSTMSFSASSPGTAGAPDLRGTKEEVVASQNRRVFLLVMGRGRHQDVSKYVDALIEFVGARVLPQDYVAVQAYNRATDFTPDHDLIRQILVRYRDAHASIEGDLSLWFMGLRVIYGSKTIPDHIQTQIDRVFATADALRPRPLAPASANADLKTESEIRRIADELRRNAEIQDRLKDGFTSLPDLSAEVRANLGGITLDEYVARASETMQDIGNLYSGIGYLRFLSGEKHLIFMTENGVSLPSQDDNASLARVAADARIALSFVQTGGVVDGGLMMDPAAATNQVFAQGFAMQDLRLMADRTGGQSMAYRTGQQAFRRLADAMGFQYLLGYSPSNASVDGKFRKVTVRVSRPGVTVLAREGYVASEVPIVPDQRKLITFSRIRAAASHPVLIDHIRVKLGKPVGSEGQVAVPVNVDISKVRFVQRADRWEADLDVAAFCGGARDEPVGETNQRVELRLTAAAHALARKEGVNFRVTVPVRGMAAIVKVVVYDHGADLVGSAGARVSR